MSLAQKFSLIWRRFSPLEEKLLAAVREILPQTAQTIFDAQVAGINLVQRHENEICFYRKLSGKVDRSGIPTFPRFDEFRLAEVEFSVDGRRYKAKLTCIGGHFFDFIVTPSPKSIAFADWDATASARLLSDPMIVGRANELQPMPDSWREFLQQHKGLDAGDWRFHHDATVYRTAFADGEFLVLAECDGDQFVLHRIEPPGWTLFYMDSHDGTPEPIKGDLLNVFRQPDSRDY